MSRTNWSNAMDADHEMIALLVEMQDGPLYGAFLVKQIFLAFPLN
jgi:hypothetical protein